MIRINPDAENEEIKQVFAHYGLAMYQAQCLERELAIFVAFVYSPDHTHMWALEERLADNFDLTFGGLASRFRELANARHSELADRVQGVVEPRNRIAHRYFWDYAAAFATSGGRRVMIDELMHATELFDKLDKELTDEAMAWSMSRGISLDDIEAAMVKLMAGDQSIGDVRRRLPKQVCVMNAYRWHGDPQHQSRFTLLLRTDDGLNLVLSNKGLCAGPIHVDGAQLVDMPEFQVALPAHVTIRPKGSSDWDFAIPLGNHYELRVKPHAERVFSWRLRRR